MANKTYTIGTATRRYLDALDAFEQFKNVFYNSLTEEYGEQSGDEMFQSHAELFEDVERAVMEYMRIQFITEMGTPADKEITI